MSDMQLIAKRPIKLVSGWVQPGKQFSIDETEAKRLLSLTPPAALPVEVVSVEKAPEIKPSAPSSEKPKSKKAKTSKEV